jgi:hypothetical protein
MRRHELPPLERVVLKDASGPGLEVVRVGSQVSRRMGYWTPAVHALLRHLEAVGFRYAPRVLGSDGAGRELLGYIPGRGSALGWASIVPEAGLAAYARLLRAYHDAVRTFVPPADAVWWCAEGAPGPGEVICHGDFGPWNLVCHRGRPVGLIDWDRAGPGRPLDDVAYALWCAAPFSDDEKAVWDFAVARPPDRRRRIALFAAAYGLESARGLVDEVIRRHHLLIAQERAAAERGFEPQATQLATAGVFGKHVEAHIRWIERHRAMFE